MIVILAPRGLPQRWMGLLLLIPVLYHPAPRPPEGDFWLSMLDVGQGLSLLVQTREHNLLFDTGPSFSPGYDSGESVVLPYLHSQGVYKLDTLLISHGDNDHIGGANSVLGQLQVKQLLGQDVEELVHPAKTLCQQGQSWSWDGIDFEILHPDHDYKKRNNRGCVLRVSNGSTALLVTADIEKSVERQLLAHYAGQLQADVLVVPHHGSKTSSTASFVTQVRADYALVSAAYRSRFGHPAAPVVKRYMEAGAQVLNTAEEGMMKFQFSRDHGVKFVESWRKRQHHYWNHPQL